MTAELQTGQGEGAGKDTHTSSSHSVRQNGKRAEGTSAVCRSVVAAEGNRSVQPAGSPASPIFMDHRCYLK